MRSIIKRWRAYSRLCRSRYLEVNTSTKVHTYFGFWLTFVPMLVNFRQLLYNVRQLLFLFDNIKSEISSEVHGLINILHLLIFRDSYTGKLVFRRPVFEKVAGIRSGCAAARRCRPGSRRAQSSWSRRADFVESDRKQISTKDTRLSRTIGEEKKMKEMRKRKNKKTTNK